MKITQIVNLRNRKGKDSWISILSWLITFGIENPDIFQFATDSIRAAQIILKPSFIEPTVCRGMNWGLGESTLWVVLPKFCFGCHDWWPHTMSKTWWKGLLLTQWGLLGGTQGRLPSRSENGSKGRKRLAWLFLWLESGAEVRIPT